MLNKLFLSRLTIAFAICTAAYGNDFSIKLDCDKDLICHIEAETNRTNLIDAVSGRSVLTNNAKSLDVSLTNFYYELPGNKAIKDLRLTIPSWGDRGFALELWICPADDNCGYAVLKRGAFGFPAFSGNGIVGLYLVTSEDKPWTPQFKNACEAGKWQHFVLSGGKDFVQIFRNGELITSASRPGIPVASPDPMLIGWSAGWGSNYNGKIGLIRIYKQPLNAEAVKRNFVMLDQKGWLPANPEMIYEFSKVVPHVALSFDGTNSFVIASELKSGLAEAITASVYLRPEQPEKNPMPILDIPGIIELYFSDKGAVVAEIITSTGRYSAKSNVPVGGNKWEWQKIAASWNGIILQIFVDGEPAGQGVYAPGKISVDKSPVFIGTDHQKRAFYRGQIAEVRISSSSFSTNIGQTVTKILNNDSIDKFTRAKSRHIVGKPEKDKPLVDFEDLTGWTVTYTAGTVEPIITRSQEEPLWGDYVLRAEFRAGLIKQPDAIVVLAPPKPVKITNDFDAVNIWRMATRYDGKNRPTINYSIQFRDATGKLHSTGNMGGFLELGWGLHHVPLTETIKAPAEFVSITFAGFNEINRVSYFDSLRFYTSSKAPIADAYVPSFKELGLPTRPETILPEAGSPAVVKLAESKNAWRFTSANKAGKTLIFDIKPAKGTLDDITATYHGKTFAPLANGGFYWADGEGMLAPNSPEVKAKFLGGKTDGNKLTLNWEYTVRNDAPVKSTWAFEVINNSLVVDLATDSGAVAEFKFGAVSQLTGKVIEVPYLNLGNWIHPSDPPGIFAGDGVYVSAFIDWYNTDCSGMFGESSSTPGGHYELNASTADHRWVPDTNTSGVDNNTVVRDYSVINGGSYYWAKTDGKRNPVRERFFVTVDDHFDEVLPSIPNPPYKHLQNTVNDVWVTRMWYAPSVPMLNYFDREFAQWQQCKAYGMDKLNVRLHPNINRIYYPRPNGDPATFIKDFVEPGIGGKAKCREFFKNMQKLGYRIGHYNNYMLLSPLSYEAWDEDSLNLDSSRHWLYSSGNHKQTKISRMVALQKKYNKLLSDTYHPNCAYLDQITCPPYCRYTDYDARTPDAGKCSAVFRVFVESLRQEERDFGPVLSEGKTQLFFAGLCDSYAQPQRMEMNLLPNFNLNKLHMLSNDAGYDLGVFYQTHLNLHYEALCYEYAYGNIAHLSGTYGNAPFETNTPTGLLKSYFLIQPMQKYYALTPIKTIEYNINGKLASIEEAIKADALAENQVKLTYANGFEAAVNMNKTKNFEVTLNGKRYTLPPAGFVAVMPKIGEAYSALINGKRTDFLSVPGFTYADGIGQALTQGPITAMHPYTLKADGEALKLIPTPFEAAETITIDLNSFASLKGADKVKRWAVVEFLFGGFASLKGADKVKLSSFDKADKPLATQELTVTNGKLALPVDGKAFAYRITRKR